MKNRIRLAALLCFCSFTATRTAVTGDEPALQLSMLLEPRCGSGIESELELVGSGPGGCRGDCDEPVAGFAGDCE